MEKLKQQKKFLLKAGDVVQVIAGKDKGTKGKILKVDRNKCRVIVEGANMLTKHVKPNQNNQQGGITRVEGPIHYSNVLLYNKDADRGERIRIQLSDDGSKTRVFAKSGTVAD